MSSNSTKRGILKKINVTAEKQKLKIMKKLALLLTGFLALTACEKKGASHQQALIVGSSIDYPPFEFLKDGEMIGFDMELVQLIAKKLNRKLEIKDMSFDAILGALQTHRIDLAISAISPSAEREKVVDFSKEYVKGRFALIVPGASEINAVKDLKRQKIGVQAGTIYEMFIKESLMDHKDINKEIEIQSLSKIPTLLQDLKTGRIACIVMGQEEALTLINSQPDLKMVSLKTLGFELETYGHAIAFSKDSPLTAEVDKILKEFEADGTLVQLKEKWFNSESINE